ncbi:UDP-glucose 4-epimerase GalE [Rhodoferax lacus]|uniref:UDP-glucose 4-epimerase n=1 Tax=Rhodoferax lacus TaxID=2184758 RepID=A0A3E1RHH3_9BURK|nr:UDP-glucose 4-epimerase GalE [Rhodoferax lacus]RFO98794.1 UDP-glucose 4-epimerase GalE [Rhodoferax lacus]
MNILLTGGAGYIGSHTYLALVHAGLVPIILDDFSNSNPKVLERLERISGKPVQCERGSVADLPLVQGLIQRLGIQAVIHFAAFKAVGESVAQPLKYYDNNVGGMTRLLQAMDAAGCRTLVFSSSATVYGDPASVPITERFPRQHTNPYGHSKLVIEDMLTALQVSDPRWKVAVLRYFNPVGAHPSGLIGEDPRGTPNNLMPFVAQVAVGRRPFLNIYGNDYPTPDGTGVRDYIHVQDLAAGHVAALKTLADKGQSFTVNLGTGVGCSVLDVVKAFEVASGKPVPYQFAPRRDGDVAQCYASTDLANTLLGWKAQFGLAAMCADTWHWQSANPNGYE